MEYITAEAYRDANPIRGLTLEELKEIKERFEIGHPIRKKLSTPIAILETNKKDYYEDWINYRFEPMPTFAMTLLPSCHREYSDYFIRGF